MLFRRRMLVCAALVLLVHGTGCSARRDAAGAAPSAQWFRDTQGEPWRLIGVSPDADWIEDAVREAALYQTFEACPLRLLACGTRWASPDALEVDDLRCVRVGPSTDRCSFRLTETLLGENGRPRSVRSRCSGHFHPVGTSHSPWQWSAASWQVPPMSCTRSR